MPALRLPRTVKLTVPPTRGKDIDAHARAMHIFLRDGGLGAHYQSRDSVRETFGVGKRTLTKKVQKELGLPQTGVFGPVTFDRLVHYEAYDAKAKALLAEHEASVKPRLVEPRQGFDSLHPSLWEAYSIGRRMGLSDLGTHNPASKLPSGAPSDHSVYPAMAFDLGIDPDTGWQNLKARAYVLRVAGRKEVEYVILGDRIWTRRGFGRYGSGGHLNHVHVSGVR